jgi:hypothetical protein
MAQVQEATASAAGIAPEPARKETVILLIVMTPLYTLSAIHKAICPSLRVSQIFLTLLLGDGSPSMSLPLLTSLPAWSCCSIMNYLFTGWTCIIILSNGIPKYIIQPIEVRCGTRKSIRFDKFQASVAYTCFWQLKNILYVQYHVLHYLRGPWPPFVIHGSKVSCSNVFVISWDLLLIFKYHRRGGSWNIQTTSAPTNFCVL